MTFSKIANVMKLSAVAFGILANPCFAQEGLADLRFGGETTVGVLQPSKRAVLRPATSGTIQVVHVVEGAHVREGMPLVTLDDRVEAARLQLAEIEASEDSALKNAIIDRDARAAELDRLRTAQQNAAASGFEIDKKESELKRASVMLEAEEVRSRKLQSAVELAKAELSKLTLSAPFDGVVIQVHADAGNSIGPSEQLITVVQLSELETELYVPMEFYGQLAAGDEFRLQTANPQFPDVRARLHHLSPVINTASNSFRCVFRIDNGNERIPSGLKVMLTKEELKKKCNGPGLAMSQ